MREHSEKFEHVTTQHACHYRKRRSI